MSLANPWQPQGVVIAHVSNTFWPGQPTVLYESGAIILSGTVFKMWYDNPVGTTTGMYYAESADGLTWSQYSLNPFISGRTRVGLKVFKSGSTYYLYVPAVSGGGIDCYTSTDGVTVTLANANCLVPSQSWENGQVTQLSVAGQDAGGTWHAYYCGLFSATAQQGFWEGHATSTDLIHWTKDVSNPVAALSTGTLSTGVAWNGSSNFTFAKIGSFWYGWSQIQLIDANQPWTTPTDYDTPSDIMRFRATSPAGPWTPLGTLTYYRTLANEGVGNTSGTPYGQVADPTIVEANGKTYMFYTASPDGRATSGTSRTFDINCAIANMTISQLVNTYEGVQNVPIPFPSSGPSSALSLNFSPAVASDNFVRADGSLGANWTQEATGTAFTTAQIASNLVESTALSKKAVYYYNASTFGNDQWSQVAVENLPSAVGAQVGVSLRNASPASSSMYEALIFNQASGGFGTSNNQVYLQKILNGTATNITTNNGIIPHAGDLITGAVCGTTLSLYYNGYLLGVGTASDLASGPAGILVQPTTTVITSAQLNNWSGGNANVIPNYPSGSSWMQAFRDFANKRGIIGG